VDSHGWREYAPCHPSSCSAARSGRLPRFATYPSAIVRRIRAQCPDKRYEGGSDAGLIRLFERNKRMLNRSDEDVIAAMTHPR